MTTQRERAQELAEDCKAKDPRATAFIEKALADAERRGMEQTIEHLMAIKKALPVQHEIESHGCCSYNWYGHVERLLRQWIKQQEPAQS